MSIVEFKKRENPKVCFAASSGGHFNQMMQMKPLMDKYDHIIVTEKTKYDKEPEAGTYYVKQVNRKEWKCLFLLIQNLLISAKILLKENPDYIITTGVLAIIPLCLLAKLFGKKIIYIESFAKIHTPTKTGKLIYTFADYFFVQWESLKEVYPNAIYEGALY